MKDYVALASGHIYSNKTNRVLRPSSNGKGYQHVVLRVGNKSIDTYVHRFIAEELIPNPKNLPEVNHKDGEAFAVYKSATHVETATGIPAGQIRSVCNGCKKSAHGYHWRYKE